MSAGACAEGFTCSRGVHSARSLCPAGRYCRAGTIDGGEACPVSIDVDASISWGLATFCPAGLTIPGTNGLLPLRFVVSKTICDAGHFCPNTTTRLPCEAGFFCEAGAFEPTPCQYDTFRSAETRCPAGSSTDTGWLLVLLVLLATTFAAVLCIVEGCAVFARRALHQALSTDEALEREIAQKISRRRRKALAEIASSMRPLTRNSSTGLNPSSTRRDSRRSGGSTPGSTLVSLVVRGLDFHIGRSRVLKDLHVSMRQGELVGLMGESGSGKSSLLNVLVGRASYGTVSACNSTRSTCTSLDEADESSSTPAEPIELNGARFCPRSLRDKMGFVPQGYIVHPQLSVYENLMCASEHRARMELGSRTELVEQALQTLGLVAVRSFVPDTSIGSDRLSGGQLRRIGIGMELVCDPPILLLDEPTSALDTVNTKLVMLALKDLTKRGVLVLASLHQPRASVLEMLDRLLLLRQGELAYGGSVCQAPAFFSRLGYANAQGINPADFYIEVCFGLVVPTGSGAGEHNGSDGSRRSGSGLLGGDDSADNGASRLASEWRQAQLRVAPPCAEVNSVDEAVSKDTWLVDIWPKRYRNMLSAQLGEAVWEQAAARAQQRGHSSWAARASRAARQTLDELASNLELSTRVEPTDTSPVAIRRFTSDPASDTMPLPLQRFSSDPSSGPSYCSSSAGPELSEPTPLVIRRASTDPHAHESFREEAERANRQKRKRLAHIREVLDSVRRSFMSRRAEVHPTLADLEHVIEHWQLPPGQMPGWAHQFWISLKRSAKKVVRKRTTLIYTRMLASLGLGLIMGGMHASVEGDTRAVMLMCTNMVFAIFVAAGSTDVVGDRRMRSLLAHESASGIRQSAEAAACMTVDIVVMLPLATTFVLSMLSVGSLRNGWAELMWQCAVLAWAAAPFGYAISIAAPDNASLLTSCSTTLIFGFFNGLVLALPKQLVEPFDGFHRGAAFWLNPGYVAYQQLALSTAFRMPFGGPRNTLTRQLVASGLLPAAPGELLMWEAEWSLWTGPCALSLVLFGVLLRAVAVFLMVGREQVAPERRKLESRLHTLTAACRSWRVGERKQLERTQAGGEAAQEQAPPIDESTTVSPSHCLEKRPSRGFSVAWDSNLVRQEGSALCAVASAAGGGGLRRGERHHGLMAPTRLPAPQSVALSDEDTGVLLDA